MTSLLRKAVRKGNKEDYESFGEIPVDDANYANIPVDIWLQQVEEDDEDDKSHIGMWCLTADNYMPRKGCLSGEHSYKVYSNDRKVLVALVHKYWLPLYKTAVEVLTKMAPDDDGTASLYYWHKNDAH